MKKLILVGTIFTMVVFSGLPLLSDLPVFAPTEEPEVKEFGGFWYAYLDFNGPYTLLEEKSEAFKKEFKKQGLTTNGSLFITFYNPPSVYKGDQLKWATCYAVDKDTAVKPPIKKIKCKKVSSVIYIHTGPFEKIWDSFNKVQDYIKEHKYDKVWPAYEIYQEDPRGTVIIHPVKK